MIEVKRVIKSNNKGIEIKILKDEQIIKVIEKGKKPIVTTFKTKETKEEREIDRDKRQPN